MGTHCMIFATFMQLSSYFKISIKSTLGDFPGGPVVSTLCFHCVTGRGTKIPTTRHMAQSKKKKKPVYWPLEQFILVKCSENRQSISFYTE